jgi:phospholipid N-methyltransferase
MNARVTKGQLAAALNAVKAIADCIRELGEVPNGELYARLMPSGIQFEQYCKIIEALKGAGVVTESNNLLKWSMPDAPAKNR